ncbi:MAG: methyltransferase domain-containing protein [Pyrinomonadaceae bacterium]
MKCLNLGCGSRYHPAWTNVDFAPDDPAVLSHDLRKGIPFPDEEFDVVYHSHVLEHFNQQGARDFLRECRRVLKQGGTVRVAVPDLELIAKTYLGTLERAAAGGGRDGDDYEWMMLELYDQAVRESTGGEMGAYLRRDPLPNREFVVARVGIEAERAIESAARSSAARPAPQPEAAPNGRRGTLLGRLRRVLSDASARREALVRRLLGAEYELLELGRFRRGGELHLWMYDRYSLARVLEGAGFREARTVGPAESRIQGWAEYHLDTEPGGAVCKPDSLFMEASK